MGHSGKNENERVLQFAEQDFGYFYELITGSRLSVIYVNDIEDLDDSEGYFILGKTLAESKGLSFNGLYTDTGYKIYKTTEGIYLYGNTEYGTLNAVYALLNQLFGLELYTDTVYEYSNTVFDYFIVENTTFNPSLDNLWAMDGAISSNDSQTVNTTYQHRLGYVNSWQIYSGTPHNFTDVVPYETYGTAHPNWYYEATDSNGTKFLTLCLASGGDDMARIVAKYVYDVIVSQDAQSNVKDFVFFGPPDARGWCGCSSSEALKTRYGANSGEYLAFMNKVAKFFDQTYNVGRKIKIYMMAYNAVLEAPAYSGELNFYKSDKVDLGVMFAPIESSFYRAITDDTANGPYGKTNAYYLTQLQNWQKFGGEVSVWKYSAQFDNYFVPVDAFTNMQATYKTYAEFGVDYFADQGVSGTINATNFNALKIYLKSKLAKDVNADFESLIRNFCNAYYGAGGNDMYNLITAEREWYATLSAKTVQDKGKDMTGCHILGNSDLFNKKYWDDTPAGAIIKKYDASMLKGWYSNHIASALAKVDADSEYANRIKIEGLSIRYMAYAVYEDDTYGDFSAIITDAKTLGITRFAEGSASTKSGSFHVSGIIDNLC